MITSLVKSIAKFSSLLAFVGMFLRIGIDLKELLVKSNPCNKVSTVEAMLLTFLESELNW